MKGEEGMFIREKVLRVRTVSGREREYRYYYLVENVRKKGKVKQRVIRYLGRKVPGVSDLEGGFKGE